MMKAYLAITVLALSVAVYADTAEERALQLNEEMDFLMGTASKPKVWVSGNLPPQSQRSGPAPTQMEGVEDIEDRFFTDQVNFQAAQAAPQAKMDDGEAEKEPSFDEAEDSYRIDGTVPKTR